MSQDLAPPWVLFVDKGKPVAILPAGRPGEVADVRHLSMKEAQRIVRLGNQLRDALVASKLREIEAELGALVSRMNDIM